MDTLASVALISAACTFLACFFLAQLLVPERRFAQRLADSLWLALLVAVAVGALSLPFLG